MPTESKGKTFELEVFELIRLEVANGLWGLKPDNTRLFLNKRYFSRDRKGLVETDIALELWRSGADSPSIIWIFECKDLARPVDVNCVEVLHAKLEQIGADKTKGTLISRGALTKHAIEYAKAKGLGVGRLIDGGISNSAWYTTLDQWKREQEQMWAVSQSLNKDLDDILQGNYKDGSDLAFRLVMSFRTFFGYLSAGIPEVGGTLVSYLVGELVLSVSAVTPKR